MHLVPDAHCHLDEIDDPAGAVRDARDVGVGPILAMGMDRGSSERSLAIAAEINGEVQSNPASVTEDAPENGVLPAVLTGVGIHPSYVPEWDDARVEAEFEYVRATIARVDCLGEVGLDYKDATGPVHRARQQELLDRQLALAATHRKPVSFHSRRAERPSVARAAEFVRATGLGINLHWFTHSEKMARRCAEAGIYISVGPAILWREEQAKVAAMIDPDLLLTETDCPVPFNDESARPSWAARVAVRLAELRSEPLELLAARLSRNFRRYVGRE